MFDDKLISKHEWLQPSEKNFTWTMQNRPQYSMYDLIDYVGRSFFTFQFDRKYIILHHKVWKNNKSFRWVKITKYNRKLTNFITKNQFCIEFKVKLLFYPLLYSSRIF